MAPTKPRCENTCFREKWNRKMKSMKTLILKHQHLTGRSPPGFAILYTIPTKGSLKALLGGWMDCPEIKAAMVEFLKMATGVKLFKHPDLPCAEDIRRGLHSRETPYSFWRRLARKAFAAIKLHLASMSGCCLTDGAAARSWPTVRGRSG
ncbi:hypothetical protein GPECTOR_1030g304 [Gonium pectorale]|uniref:Uncharacterized protein n=1 Tax=Gonium pectorale TaxID=33097 RepID=A0A150FTQ2_GONPE|nr:hypothetical protein GPECTOR_1030g304 [Gonium pectorale]|eukprot:KXZ40993.1 hypothetical protein GPECTOR_1030g304 [Gonium pectorale]